jgi:hypothetical protein
MVEIKHPSEDPFKVNGARLKVYEGILNEEEEEPHFDA